MVMIFLLVIHFYLLLYFFHILLLMFCLHLFRSIPYKKVFLFHLHLHNLLSYFQSKFSLIEICVLVLLPFLVQAL